jgi:hypothetical protein
MRLLFMTMLASLSTIILGFLCPSAASRAFRLAASAQHPLCRHCGMNELTRTAQLCTYCD